MQTEKLLLNGHKLQSNPPLLHVRSCRNHKKSQKANQTHVFNKNILDFPFHVSPAQTHSEVTRPACNIVLLLQPISRFDQEMCDCEGSSESLSLKRFERKQHIREGGCGGKITTTNVCLRSAHGAAEVHSELWLKDKKTTFEHCWDLQEEHVYQVHHGNSCC